MTAFSIESDSLFSTVAESIGLIVMVWDLSEDVIHFSDQWSVLTGRPAGVQSMTPAQFGATIHVDDLAALNATILHCLKGRETFYDAEIRVWRQSREWQWLSVRGRVVARDAERRATRVVATFMDASDRKLAERVLAESEERYHSIFETSVHGILLGIPNGKLLSVNPAACTMTGYSEAELISTGLGGIVDPLDLRAESFLRAYVESSHCSGEIRIIRKDGEPIEVAVSSVVYAERSGAMRASLILQDVTHTRLVERKLLRLTNLHATRSRCNHAISHSHSAQEMFDSVCRIVVECNEFGLTWIACADGYAVEVAAASAKGAERDYLDGILLGLDPALPVGVGPLARAIRHRSVIVTNDFLSDPSTQPWHDRAAKHGLRSAAVFPLEQAGSTIGALVLHSTELHYFDQQLVDLVREIAQDISFGLDNLARAVALSNSESRFRTLWETSTDAILMMDEQSLICYANPAVRDVFGYRPEVLIGQSLAMLQPARLREGHQNGMTRYLTDGTQRINWRAAHVPGLHCDGHEIPLEIAFSEAHIGGKRLFIGCIHDITERKRAHDLITYQNRILKMISTDAVIDETLGSIANMVKELTSDVRCSIQGLSERDGSSAWPCAVGMPEPFRRAVLDQFSGFVACTPGPGQQKNQPVITVDFEHDEAYAEYAAAARERDISGCCTWPVFGRQQQALATVALYYRQARAPTEWELALVLAAIDLTELAIENKRSDERIRHLAHSDELTGLPNRARFLQDLTQAIARGARSMHRVGLLFMDLDRFKNINDTFGHDAGDQVLCEVARRLRAAVRDVDIVARLGGDEFVVVVENVNDSGLLATIATKLIDQIVNPIEVGARQFHLTASIGISVYPNDGNDIHALIKNADVAMYRVKETGRNGFQFYAEQMSAGSLERMLLESGLRHALEHDELVLHYQPKLCLLTGDITGIEALVRWQHPEMGLLRPLKFISLAEETGLIVAIGRWVLQAACRQMKSWIDASLAPPRVAVNLSARQFRHEKLFEDIDGALRQYGLPPHLLELEITESLVMDNPDHAVQLLDKFKAMGIHLAMDDFGTGYSSLANLKQFPFDTVKVDRSFVRDLALDPNDAAISRAIIAMAHALQLRVVAEGVETEAQLEFLRAHGCDEIQGHHFAMPMSADALSAFLHAHRARHVIAAAPV